MRRQLTTDATGMGGDGGGWISPAGDGEALAQALLGIEGLGVAQMQLSSRRFVVVNPAFCTMTGYRAAELIGADAALVEHPEDTRANLMRLASLLRGDGVPTVERRYRRKDGSIIRVRTDDRLVVLRDTSRHFLSVVQDITSQREIERALQASEARQALLVRLNDRQRVLEDPHEICRDAAGLLAIRIGAHRVLYAEEDGNGCTMTVLGSYPDGIPFSNVARHLASWGADLRDRLALGRTLVWSNLAEAPGRGRDREATAGIAVPLAAAGRSTGLLLVQSGSPRSWTDEDVAMAEQVAVRLHAELDRARARTAMREANAKLHAAMESMGDAIAITDKQGEFVDFNEAFAIFHRFGHKANCPRTPAGLARLLEICSDEGRPLPPGEWPASRALRSESGHGVEYSLRRTDTGERWFGSYTFTPIRGPDGGIIGSVTSARDVTTLRRLRSELLASQADLRRLIVREGDAQERERLRIARELHDELQQHLAAIMMEAEVARSATQPGHDAVREALARIDHLAAGINDSIRRIVRDLRPHELQELGLVAALQTMADGFESRHRIRCTLDSESLTPPDEARLAHVATCFYRVAQEALVNVARHADARSVAIRLDSQADGVRLTVVDDGIGIAQGELAKANSFGLLGMRERVRGIGGRLTVTGNPGRGTTVAIDLAWPAASAPRRS